MSTSTPTRGKLIIVEGPDYAGSTTAIGMIKDYLDNFVHAKTHVFREPGGYPIGELIRETIFKARELETPDSSSAYRALLFYASRISLYEDFVEPLLAAGDNVILDRCWLTTFVYQGLKDKNLQLVAGLQDLLEKQLPELFKDFLGIVVTANVETIVDRIESNQRENTNSYDPTTAEDVKWQVDGYNETAGALKFKYIVENNGTVEQLRESITDIIDEHFADEIDAKVNEMERLYSNELPLAVIEMRMSHGGHHEIIWNQELEAEPECIPIDPKNIPMVAEQLLSICEDVGFSIAFENGEWYFATSLDAIPAKVEGLEFNASEDYVSQVIPITDHGFIMRISHKDHVDRLYVVGNRKPDIYKPNSTAEDWYALNPIAINVPFV